MARAYGTLPTTLLGVTPPAGQTEPITPRILDVNQAIWLVGDRERRQDEARAARRAQRKSQTHSGPGLTGRRRTRRR